jgi:FHA domain
VTVAVPEAALATDETLLILKIAFLVLLYSFIVYVVRSATKDISEAPQESIILGAAEADAARAKYGVAKPSPARFVVLESPGLDAGSAIELTTPSIVGREAASVIELGEDDFASARHARIEPRTDGVWVEDLNSTNGTFVNGGRIAAERLKPGDVLRIGQTELLFEP